MYLCAYTIYIFHAFLNVYFSYFQFKCGNDSATYAELMKGVKPCLEKLGILSPEEMGYDKPEFFWPNASDVHDFDPVTKMPR